MKRLSRTLFSLLVAVPLACGGGDTGAPTGSTGGPVLSTVTVSLSPVTVLIGQTAQATASGFDQNGAPIAVGTVTWSSSSATIATINSAGTVSAVGAGQAVITASASGKTGSATLTVSAPTPVLTTLNVALASSTIQVGQATTATATGLDQSGIPIGTGTVTWTSTSPSVATVSIGGNVLGVAAGTTSIVATASGKTGSAPLTVSPLPANDPLLACRLPARYTDVGLGFPRIANRLKSTGDVRVTVLFVDFPDAVATRTTQSAFSILSPTAENYWKAISYSKMNLILDPQYVWLRMSKPSTDYGWSSLTNAAHKAYIQEALNLAPASTNFSNSDAVAIISNPDAGALSNGPTFIGSPTNGVTAGGKTFNNAITSGRDLTFWGGYWFNHEGGHMMGLVDLYAYVGSTHRFVGGWSLMGNIAGPSREYLGWERWLLGWLNDDQVTCATQTGTSTFTLTPLERLGGAKLLVIPTGTTTAIVVESRRPEGFDGAGINSGPLVYTIDTSVISGAGVLKVLPINDLDASKTSAPLQVLQGITFGGVTVTLLSQDATGDRVQVVR